MSLPLTLDTLRRFTPYDLKIMARMVAPDSRRTICDNCASDFHPKYAQGLRLYGERAWVCSPACAAQLKVRWQ